MYSVCEVHTRLTVGCCLNASLALDLALPALEMAVYCLADYLNLRKLHVKVTFLFIYLLGHSVNIREV